jgi:hypothetical protein
MPITLLDIVLIVVMLVSGLLGFARSFRPLQRWER